MRCLATARTVPSVCDGEECGGAAVLEHDGSVYSCDTTSFLRSWATSGNTVCKQPIRSDRQKRFGRQKYERLTSTCRRCEYLSLCYGECPRNRFALSPSGERGHNYLCAGLKQFFQHTEPYMRFMRRELMSNRPAANVMDWAATPGDRWIRGKNPTAAGRPARLGDARGRRTIRRTVVAALRSTDVIAALTALSPVYLTGWPPALLAGPDLRPPCCMVGPVGRIFTSTQPAVINTTSAASLAAGQLSSACQQKAKTAFSHGDLTGIFQLLSAYCGWAG